jgi:hypothetical protein
VELGEEDLRQGVGDLIVVEILVKIREEEIVQPEEIISIILLLDEVHSRLIKILQRDHLPIPAKPSNSSS